jgi:hypothetical protein
VKGIEDLNKILAEYKRLNVKSPDISRAADQTSYVNSLTQNLEAVKKVAVAVGGKVQEVLAPAFSQFFTNLISGSQNALQAFSSFFKQILAQIASTIASAAALSAILSLIPGFQTGSGASGFGGIFKDLLGFGKGAGLGFEGFGNAYSKVQFEISGTKLIGVLNRAGNSNGRQGG